MVLSVYNTEQPGIAPAEKDSKNAIFMFFQVLIDVLLKMTFDRKSTAKQDLIDHVKRVYEGDTAQLQVITEFENEYRSGKAVWWYSRHNLFFSTLNKALRDADYEIIFAMRFFITDLCAQLTSEHQHSAASSRRKDPILRVYRGQNISTREMNYLVRNVGQFISFQNLLSTSLDREIARFFVDSSAPITADNTRILLQLDIDTQLKNTKPYANVTDLSFYGDEEEVLIMLGCIFRLDQLEFNKLEHCWIATLSLCSEDQFELSDLMKQTKSDIGDDVTSLGCLLSRRGDYEQAEKYYLQLLLDSSIKQLDRARCYHGLGAIAAAHHHHDQALEHYSRELEIHVKRRNRINIALTHMVMGEVYWKKGDLDTALAYEKEACPVLRSLGNRQLSNAYLTMGSIYRSKKNPELAIRYYKKALEFDRKHLPANHENFGIIYINMGLAYDLRQEHGKALDYCRKGKEVLLKSLPPTNPKISQVEGYIDDIERKSGLNKKF